MAKRINLHVPSAELNAGVNRLGIILNRCETALQTIESPTTFSQLKALLDDLNKGSRIMQGFAATPNMADYASKHLHPYNDAVEGLDRDVAAEFAAIIGKCEAAADGIWNFFPKQTGDDGVEYLAVSYGGGSNARTATDRTFEAGELQGIAQLLNDLIAVIPSIEA